MFGSMFHQKPRVEECQDIFVHFSGTYRTIFYKLKNCRKNLCIKHVVQDILEVIAHDDGALKLASN